MALIVEDGSRVANAESYASVAAADTYLAARGIAAWAGGVAATKEAALRRATDYMLEAYRGRWKGYRYDALQSLDWPRQAVLLDDVPLNAWVPYNIVPKEVINACCELAYKYSQTGELFPDITPQKLSAKVGDIAVTYNPNSPNYTQFAAVDMMLRPFLDHGGGNSIGLVRV